MPPDSHLYVAHPQRVRHRLNSDEGFYPVTFSKAESDFIGTGGVDLSFDFVNFTRQARTRNCSVGFLDGHIAEMEHTLAQAVQLSHAKRIAPESVRVRVRVQQSQAVN